jgi:hypothetical protein
MVGGLWLALPDTPDKDIGLSYFGVVRPHVPPSNPADPKVMVNDQDVSKIPHPSPSLLLRLFQR